MRANNLFSYPCLLFNDPKVINEVCLESVKVAGVQSAISLRNKAFDIDAECLRKCLFQLMKFGLEAVR